VYHTIWHASSIKSGVRVSYDSMAHSVDRLFARRLTDFSRSSDKSVYRSTDYRSIGWFQKLLCKRESWFYEVPFVQTLIFRILFWDHFNENNITTNCDLLRKGHVYSGSTRKQRTDWVCRTVWHMRLKNIIGWCR